MSEVVSLEDYKTSKEPHFSALVFCIGCGHKWIGTVPQSVNLFKLECSGCGTQNSFASILPTEYLNKPGAKK